MDTQAQMQVDPIQVRGMFRINLTEGGKLVGDSGWMDNQVVNLGFNHYLVSSLGAIGGSKQITHMGLGTGSQPGAAGTSLEGETDKRTSVTAATTTGSKTLRLTATFGSSDSFVTATRSISNVGLFNTSAAGSLFAGNTFASSSCATNQQVECTYDVIFS